MANSATSTSPEPTSYYVNVDINNQAAPFSPLHNDNSPLQREESLQGLSSGPSYMNINPGQENVDPDTAKPRPPPLPLATPAEAPQLHCYANLEANEIETLRKRYSGAFLEKNPPPSTPTCKVIREVNYAVLDLDQKADDANGEAAPSPPDSPNRQQKGYATIDFNKTVALSHSVNPVNDNEGSRKTRHNSDINDLTAPARHSSSISE